MYASPAHRPVRRCDAKNSPHRHPLHPLLFLPSPEDESLQSSRSLESVPTQTQCLATALPFEQKVTHGTRATDIPPSDLLLAWLEPRTRATNKGGWDGTKKRREDSSGAEEILEILYLVFSTTTPWPPTSALVDHAGDTTKRYYHVSLVTPPRHEDARMENVENAPLDRLLETMVHSLPFSSGVVSSPRCGALVGAEVAATLQSRSIRWLDDVARSDPPSDLPRSSPMDWRRSIRFRDESGACSILPTFLLPSTCPQKSLAVVLLL